MRRLASLVGSGFPVVVTLAQPGQVWETLPWATRRDGYRRARVADVLWLAVGRDALRGGMAARRMRTNHVQGRAVLVTDGGPNDGRRTTRRLDPSTGGVSGYRLVSDPNRYRPAARMKGADRNAAVGPWTTGPEAARIAETWRQETADPRLVVVIERETTPAAPGARSPGRARPRRLALTEV